MNNLHDVSEYQHVPVPLPFDENADGTSVRMIESHWENNYGGAAKALNTVRLRLVQGLNDTNTPPVYNDRRGSLCTGSVADELYFANLGGGGKAGVTRATDAASHGT